MAAGADGVTGGGDGPWTDEEIVRGPVRLRAFADRDKPVIAVLYGDSEVRRYLGGPLDAETLAAIPDAVVGRRPGVFCVADAGTDEAVGSVSVSRERGEAEVSYELVPSAWGRGLAAEAVSALLGWLWRHGDDASVIAVTQEANARSRALLGRLGFVEERRFVEFGALQVQYRLSRPGTADRPAWVLHDHRRPRQHWDLRLEEDGVLRSWALPKGLPDSPSRNRLAVPVPDHDLDHLAYEDADKSVADTGWWEEHDRSERRFVFTLHGRETSRRYAMIRTGQGWLLHLTKDQP